MNDLELKKWLATNLESLACVPGAICTVEDGTDISYETEPDDWLITNPDQVDEFIKTWESRHEAR